MLPLPVDSVIPAVLAAVRDHGAAVVVAPPGSGKTTRVPPALLGALPGKVLLLQPRRVAARLCAARIAQERGVPLGGEVGYRVRFERKVGANTRLEVLTEGLLTRALQADPFLEGVSAVVLDEFHERSLHADLCLALLREVQEEARPDLKIVVMSATLDPGPVSRFLGEAPVVEASGRTFPVEVQHRVDEGWTAERVARAVRAELPPQGHTLVFLPGVGEIRRAAELLADLDAEVLPLHGSLKAADQDRALARSSRRKVVLATNIAETSVTLEGVRLVIDSGLARVPRFDPAIGLTRLELGQISQASADQRAGRAGRTGPGRALRLWQRGLRLRPAEEPELSRVDLSEVLLQVMAWGGNPAEFAWFQPPTEAALSRGMQLLATLGAVSGDSLTALGHTLARFPLHPRLGALLVAAHGSGVLDAAATAAALVSERDPFADTSFHGLAEDDLLARIQALEQGRRAHRRSLQQVRRVREQLLRVARRVLGPGPAERRDRRALVQALLAGFPDRVARRRSAGSRRFLMVGGSGALLDEGSLVDEGEFILAVGLDGARRGERAEHRVRIAARVERDWLPLEERPATRWDRERQAVRSELTTCYQDLVLARRDGPGDPAEEAAMLAQRARQRPGDALNLDREVQRFLDRWRALRRWMPELDLPDLDPVALLPELAVGRRSFRELRALDLLSELQGRLSWQQRQLLDSQAPERLKVPSGSSLRLDYSGETPALAARIQQLFGMQETPRVAGGRVPITVHLLAPNNRPQQVTADLAGFWERGYPELRKELRGRYPKHAWPEKPGREHAEDRPRRRR